ncbi:TauD/TfdA family dioxygenase [Rickettsiella massiliensis]|uniref:TauD/TfdA family dioxygenase n=1 Tax=Rickettsiella massiliensis TaxID=676517 RepID=UPI00029A31AE|nr:TauD/TfdA family dioxygenase [Rickettsiella massiliensis]
MSKSILPTHNLENIFHKSQKLEIPQICYLKVTHHKVIPYAHISEILDKYGLSIITLNYQDKSATFKKIINTLGHPHLHKEENSYLWDIKVVRGKKMTQPLARSHKDDEFHFHTDCSYEENVPDYFALYVLHADKKLGGNNLILDVKWLKDALSHKSLKILKNIPITINVPKEFFKGIDFIKACIFDKYFNIRYRREIINFDHLTSEQFNAISELEHLIYLPKLCRGFTLRDNQILILSNKRFLHAKTQINDPERHLQRIRFFKTSSALSSADQKKNNNFLV